VTDRPSVGSVAWWSGNHVAYVEAVRSTSEIQITEMNYDNHNGWRRVWIRRGERWPDGFIHAGQRA